MKMKKTNIIIAILVLSLIHAAYALPALPSYFYGSAQVNGRAVPFDSVITARIGEEDHGSFIVEV